jgi:hypothetical protein
MTDTDKCEPLILANDDSFRDDYARTTSWAAILKPHGWECKGSDPRRGDRWVPPGRTRVAAFTREHGCLYVFTSSTEFEPRTEYSKFDAYAILNHRGDRQAAAKALYYSQHVGVFRERDSSGNQIVRCGKHAYIWPADREPLAVGNTVELPPPKSAEHRELYGDKPRRAEVTQLGTRYHGDLAEVVRRILPDDHAV